VPPFLNFSFSLLGPTALSNTCLADTATDIYDFKILAMPIVGFSSGCGTLQLAIAVGFAKSKANF